MSNVAERSVARTWARNVIDLPALLSEKLGQTGELKVYVRGDGETPYRIVAYVLDIAKQAGADVSLVTEPTVKKK